MAKDYEISVDGEYLHPELICDEDGAEWVQIADENGMFTGYEPTAEQVRQAVMAGNPELSEEFLDLRVYEVFTATTRMHKELLKEGAGRVANNIYVPEIFNVFGDLALKSNLGTVSRRELRDMSHALDGAHDFKWKWMTRTTSDSQLTTVNTTGEA